MMTKPKRLSRTAIYENPWLNLYADQVALPSGRIIENYHVLEFENAVAGVLVENADDALLLIEAYRYPTDSIEWEIPGGYLEPSESITESAQREVLEETGYQTTEHEKIYNFFPMAGLTNQVFHLVRCRATSANGKFDQNEVRSYRWFARQEIEQMLRDNLIRDAFTLVGLLFYLTTNWANSEP
jgi:ADP-ribose pyrophosphatase